MAGFKKGPNGMLYNIVTDKSGPTIKEGDFIAVNLTAKNDADSVLFSTYDSGSPVPKVVPPSQTKGDIFDGIKMLSEGDSATIKVFVDSVYKGQQKPQGFKGKYIVYDVKVVKVIPKGTQTDQVFNGVITNLHEKP